MKYFIPLILIALTSCTKIYQEVYTIEKYPIEWEEEIVISGEHEHYYVDDNPKCLYYETDTFCWHHYDTIVVRKFEGRTRVK
jgi:hypothetical protein